MSENVDPAELQRDLDRIKDAMGIADRYAGAVEQWLVFGVLVAVASALSQYVVLERLPDYWFAVIWLGVLGGGTAVLSWRYDNRAGQNRSQPNVVTQIFVSYFASFGVLFAVAPVIGDVGYLAWNATLLGVVLVMLGVGYLVASETLKAHRIRARDRYAFAVGGVILVALGVAIPNVEALHTWGYAVFGATYLLYAVASYGVLART
jgi:hypothetical protein